jgi:hypothetical protein
MAMITPAISTLASERKRDRERQREREREREKERRGAEHIN